MKQLIFYLFLGFTNFLVFSSVFYVLYHYLEVYYLWANGLAYILSITTAILGGRYFVFHRTRQTELENLEEYKNSYRKSMHKSLWVYLSSLIIELTLSKYLVESYVVNERLWWNVTLLQNIIYIVMGGYCFVLNKYWAYRHVKESKQNAKARVSA